MAKLVCAWVCSHCLSIAAETIKTGQIFSFTVVWIRLNIFTVLTKTSSLCSRTLVWGLRGGGHATTSAPHSVHFLCFPSILEEPPLLCLLAVIVSGSVTQQWKHVLRCLLATMFVDFRAESWGKTQQQDNHFCLLFWPHFILSLLCLLRKSSFPLKEEYVWRYNDSRKPV